MMFSVEVNMSGVVNAAQLPKGIDQVFGFSGMLIGLSTLTEANINEWAVRLEFYERLGMTVLHEVRGKGKRERHTHRNLNYTELSQLIGGVVPPAEDISRKKFMKHLHLSLEREMGNFERNLSKNAVNMENVRQIVQFAIVTTEPPTQAKKEKHAQAS